MINKGLPSSSPFFIHKQTKIVRVFIKLLEGKPVNQNKNTKEKNVFQLNPFCLSTTDIQLIILIN